MNINCLLVFDALVRHILDGIVKLYKYMPSPFYQVCKNYAYEYVMNTALKNNNSPNNIFDYLCELIKLGFSSKHNQLMHVVRRKDKIGKIMNKI